MKKKLIAMILTVALSFTIAGCGKTEEERTRNTSTSSSAATSTHENNVRTTISERENQMYSSIVIALLESGIWLDNPDYVVGTEDLKKYFDEFSDDNRMVQFYIAQGIADYNNTSVVTTDTGKYHFIADREKYMDYMTNMFGVNDDFYLTLDGSNSDTCSLLYDEDTDAIYASYGYVSLQSCTFDRVYEDDNYLTNYVFKVSTKNEDSTTLDGEITIKVAITECIGWNEFIQEITFTPAN